MIERRQKVFAVRKGAMCCAMAPAGHLWLELGSTVSAAGDTALPPIVSIDEGERTFQRMGQRRLAWPALYFRDSDVEWMSVETDPTARERHGDGL